MDDVIIGLVGEFGIANFGNEASLAALLLVLRALPSVSPLVICDSPEPVRTEHGVPATELYATVDRSGPVRKVLGKIADFRQVHRAVRRTDAVVVPGTGILESLWVEPGGIPLSLAWVALSARLQRKPLLVISIGVDRAAHPLARLLVRFTLGRASYLSVRDQASADAVQRLGLPRPPVAPDVVFGIRPEAAAAVPAVALGVIDYHGMAGDPATGQPARTAYLDQLQAIVTGLVVRGRQVRIVVGAKPDHRVAGELMDRVRAAGLAGVELAPSDNLTDLLSHVRDAELLVGSRFHNLVAALAAGVPVVSIGYGQKQVELMREFGSPDFDHPIDALDADAVLADVDRVLADRDRYAAAVVTRTEQLRTELDDQWRHLQATLPGVARPAVTVLT